jgi:hypothetical protein
VCPLARSLEDRGLTRVARPGMEGFESAVEALDPELRKLVSD